MKWLALVLVLLAGCSPAPPLERAPTDCGKETRTHQGGVNEAGRQCLWDAYSKRQAAVFEVTRYTIEGDPVILKLSVGPGKIQASVDTRQDRFSAKQDRKVTTYTCATLKKETSDPAFLLEGCTGGENAGLRI